tara:strand:+ start:1790 stop:2251 length:462 start_codon:yes stop_codon:yes gene_type:complete
MIRFFKRLFGSPEIVKESLGIIRDAGDALWYTDEEKAQDSAKRSVQADALLLAWIDSTQGQNLARRFLAIMLTGIWASMFLLGTIGDMAAPFLSLRFDFKFMEAWRESSLAISTRTEQMTGAMMLILGFYFAAPHLDKIVGKAIEKFSGDKNK